MEAQLSEDKLSRIQIQLATWLGRNKATKRQMLSLVGLLQHTTKVVDLEEPLFLTTKLPESKSYTTTLLLQKPLNPTCTGGISLSTVRMVSASSSVYTYKPPLIVKLQQMLQAQFRDHWF